MYKSFRKFIGEYGPKMFVREDGQDDDFDGDTDAPSGNGEGEDSPQARLHREMLDKLTQVNTATNANAKLLEFASDPEVQRLMAARASGKKLKFVDEDEAAPQPVGLLDSTVTDEQLAEMNSAQLARYIDQQFKVKAPSLAKAAKASPETIQLQQQVAALEAKLQSLEGFKQSKELEDAKAQVTEAKKLYPDFERHRKTMADLSSQFSGLSIKELYALAKTRAGESITTSRSLASERPQSGGSRFSERNNTNKPKTFANALEASLRKRSAEHSFDED